jgi:hypothetical protein
METRFEVYLLVWWQMKTHRFLDIFNTFPHFFSLTSTFQHFLARNLQTPQALNQKSKPKQTPFLHHFSIVFYHSKKKLKLSLKKPICRIQKRNRSPFMPRDSI